MSVWIHCRRQGSGAARQGLRRTRRDGTGAENTSSSILVLQSLFYLFSCLFFSSGSNRKHNYRFCNRFLYLFSCLFFSSGSNRKHNYRFAIAFYLFSCLFFSSGSNRKHNDRLAIAFYLFSCLFFHRSN